MVPFQKTIYLMALVKLFHCFGSWGSFNCNVCHWQLSRMEKSGVEISCSFCWWKDLFVDPWNWQIIPYILVDFDGTCRVKLLVPWILLAYLKLVWRFLPCIKSCRSDSWHRKFSSRSHVVLQPPFFDRLVYEPWFFFMGLSSSKRNNHLENAGWLPNKTQFSRRVFSFPPFFLAGANGRGSERFKARMGDLQILSHNRERLGAWNPNDPCFLLEKRPYFGWLTFKTRGHWGSRS